MACIYDLLNYVEEFANLFVTYRISLVGMHKQYSMDDMKDEKKETLKVGIRSFNFYG